ncbi:hypothetical protein QCA50_015173 [Cerrena zonata]|uniref:Uncharacterized protein n=1 Tax=Cerrena zonata TaxID=2478898 RepID=A0AAW0FWT3_9APHY
MSHSEQFTLYTHAAGPNGWKIVYVFEELGLTYKSIYLRFDEGDHQKPEFTKYNPNGRVPALIDHGNQDFVIWESDAILLYLVDKYDTLNKLTVPDDAGKIPNHTMAVLPSLWSRVVPYFGQFVWFKLSPEQIISAQERYKNEISRVWGVLESVLSKKDWLVGNKPTIADLSFIPWNEGIKTFLVNETIPLSLEQFPSVAAWHNRMMALDCVRKAHAIQAEALK